MDEVFRWWYRASALRITASFSYRLETDPAVQVTGSGSDTLPRNGFNFFAAPEGENPDTPARIDILSSYEFYAAGPFASGSFLDVTYAPVDGPSYSQQENFGMGMGDGPQGERGYLNPDGFYLAPWLAITLGSYPGKISGSLFGASFQTAATVPDNVKNASANVTISFSGGDLPLL